MKKLLNIIIAVSGVMLIIYSIGSCALFNFNLGNYLPGIIGLFMLLYAVFFDKINCKESKGFLKLFKYTINGGIIFVIVSFVLMCSMIFAASKNVPEKNADALIVLGAGLRGDRITGTLALRLNEALEYHAQNPSSVFVLSGGQGSDELITEAEAMRRYLISNGIDEAKILLEDKSTSTEENFNFSKQVLDKHFGKDSYTAIYITNDFHLLRAGFYAKKAGLASAEGLAAPSQWYMLPNYYSREYLAVMWYFASNFLR